MNDDSEQTFDDEDSTNGQWPHDDSYEMVQKYGYRPYSRQWNLRERFEYVRENWNFWCWFSSFFIVLNIAGIIMNIIIGRLFWVPIEVLFIIFFLYSIYLEIEVFE